MSPVGLRTVLWPWPPSLLFHESLLLVCESTWKVLPLMSDVVPVLAASVWSSCKGFSFFRLLNIWRHWSITKGEESDGGQVVFRGRSIKNQPFAPTSSKSSCLIWFDFILKILGVQLLFDACSLYTFIQFSLCACLTLLRMIWPVMRLMFLMSKATNKSVFVSTQSWCGKGNRRRRFGYRWLNRREVVQSHGRILLKHLQQQRSGPLWRMLLCDCIWWGSCCVKINNLRKGKETENRSHPTNTGL